MAWIQSTGGLPPVGNVKWGRTSHDPFCMVTVRSLWFALSRVIPHHIAFVLTRPPGRWAGGCTHCSQTPWRNPSFSWVSMGTLVGTLWLEQEPCSLLACLLWALWGPTTAWAQVVILEPQPLGAPVYMCFHSLSLQGSDLPSKITSTFFFCILINTKEAGAVNLYLGENLRTGLLGVAEPLTAFNTQLVISFVHLFSVFISTDKHCNYSY